jgi:YHS domain-containing protein
MNFSRRLPCFVAFAAFLFAFVSFATAAEKPVNTTLLGGLALKGYDAVAYFTEKKPVKGLKEHSFAWNGATWRFASEENLRRFEAEPARYAPQYGGYCAYAVSEGYTADIDPEAWDIVNGKLYLNYSKKVQVTWREKRDERIAQADTNWPKLTAGKK